jgi:hypothetical protein
LHIILNNVNCIFALKDRKEQTLLTVKAGCLYLTFSSASCQPPPQDGMTAFSATTWISEVLFCLLQRPGVLAPNSG